MKKIDRFLQYLNYKGITENRATIECGLSNGLIGQAKRGKSDLGEKATEKILNKYQDLQRVWLLTGEGEMLKNSEKKSLSKEEENTITISREVFDQITKLTETVLSQQQAILSQQQTIKELIGKRDSDAHTGNAHSANVG